MLLNHERLRSAMSAHQLDAIVATAPENVLYTSGFWSLPQWIRRGPQAFVVWTSGEAYGQPVVIAGTSTLDLVADQRVAARIRRYGAFPIDHAPSVELDPVSARQAALHALADDGDAIKALVLEIRQAGLEKARIGIDEMGLLPGDTERLRSDLPGVTWVMAAQIFRNIRAVKTPLEVDRLRTVAAITERSVAAALAIATEGVTEIELARAFHGQTVREDAVPVLGCIGFGERSALMNVQPSERRLRQGDVIRFDVGGHYGNYRADIARIASLGSPSKEIQVKYDALNKGVQRGIELIRPGLAARDVFQAVVETVRSEGIAQYQRSHVGHGIGLDGYDAPLLSATSGDVLEEGMVVCIETPYYELGRIGLQVEDMLVVRAGGADMLSNNGNSMTVLG